MIKSESITSARSLSWGGGGGGLNACGSLVGNAKTKKLFRRSNRIILKWIFDTYDLKVLNELHWLMQGFNSKFFLSRVIQFRFNKEMEVSLPGD